MNFNSVSNLAQTVPNQSIASRGSQSKLSRLAGYVKKAFGYIFLVEPTRFIFRRISNHMIKQKLARVFESNRTFTATTREQKFLEKMIRQSPTTESKLNHKHMGPLFEAFSKSEFNEENLYFYKDSLQLERKPKSGNTLGTIKNTSANISRLKVLKERFLLPDSPQSINIAAADSKRILASLGELDSNPLKLDFNKITDAVDQVNKRLIYTMGTDSMPRFLAKIRTMLPNASLLSEIDT